MDLNKDVVAQYGLIGDAAITLGALRLSMGPLDHAPARARSDVPQRIAAIREEWLGKWMPKLSSEATPINPYRVIWELNRLVNKQKTTITHDAGSPRDQITPFWEANAPLSSYNFV